MPAFVRAIFPYFFLLLAAGALAWAASFGTLPEADFSFVNGTEPQTIDPATATGVPESRVIYALFEGLYNFHPETLEPIPGVAERYEVSDNQQVYTFFIRKDAKWSDGSELTAEDFHWSWKRMLHPKTASEYVYQGYYIKNAKKFNTIDLKPGDPVEVEFNDPENPRSPQELYPSGPIEYGILESIEYVPESQEGIRPAEEEPDPDDFKIYTIKLNGNEQRCCTDQDVAEKFNATWVRNVLFDFREVGVEVLDQYTLKVTLESPTPYFIKLAAFYTLFPVHRESIEKYGRQEWNKPQNLVCNGAYTLEFRRIRDRLRLRKNPQYWNHEEVSIETIDVLAVESEQTALNLYLTGQADWIPAVPTSIIPELLERDDFGPESMLTTYFYRINLDREPLAKLKVRQALAKAINKRAIVNSVTKAGEIATNLLVPPGIEGYDMEITLDHDPAEAQRLLAEAGYPNGEGFPTIEILYNESEAHRKIAEVIQSNWKEHLGIDVKLANQEWASYLDSVQQQEYWVARAGWVGDYVDPNTFLDMFVTDGPQNSTGWSNERYDELIVAASKESDSKKRLAMLKEAEQILIQEQPIIPIYHYVSKNMVRPYVKGFKNNLLDLHPLWALSIDQEAKRQAQAKLKD